MPDQPSQSVRVSREGEHYRVTARDLHGRQIRNRRSPQFSTLAMRRTWAIQQAERWAEQHYLRWDERIEGEPIETPKPSGGEA